MLHADREWVPNPRIDIARAILSTILRVVVQSQPQRGKRWTSDRIRLTAVEESADAA